MLKVGLYVHILNNCKNVLSMRMTSDESFRMPLLVFKQSLISHDISAHQPGFILLWVYS